MNKTIEHHLGTVHVADCHLSIELITIGSKEENKATVKKIVDYLIREEFIPDINYQTKITNINEESFNEND